MFWKFNYAPSHVDSLLEKQDVTLKELMDEENIVQECKSENKKLIDFLLEPPNFRELVEMVIKIPENDVEERLKYKYANVACDLITSDVTAITEALVSNEELLGSIYGFLEWEPPLNCLQASFFSKIMGLIIARKSEMMVEFIKSRNEFVTHLVQHLGTSAIMDLLLRLITCVEPAECRACCIEWLNEKNLVKLLVQCINKSHSAEKHTNAAQSLCDIIRLSREQSTIGIMIDGDSTVPQFSGALLRSIESQETISQLLNQMFDGEPCESVIVNGLYVIQTLLETKKFGADAAVDITLRGDGETFDSTDGSSKSGKNCTIEAIIPRLQDFQNLLHNPPKQHYIPMPSTSGSLPHPLGLTRLQVVRLVATLIHTNSLSVASRLAELGSMGTILDLFFQYSWNNFLHTQVENCLIGIISSPLPDNPLQKQIFTDYHLLERISESFDDFKLQQTDAARPRHGYFGHLTRLANHLVGSVDPPGDTAAAAVPENPGGGALNKVVRELPDNVRDKWEACVTGALSEINKLNTVELVSSSCGGLSAQSSSDEDDEFRNIVSYPSDDVLQKAFYEYQNQQMTNSFVDQFGFNEEDFAEQEEMIGSPFNDRVSSINFELTMVEDNPTSAALFEQACNDRIRQFDNADSDEELDITFSHVSDRRQSSVLGSSLQNKKGHSSRMIRTSSRRDSDEADDDDEGDFDEIEEREEGSESEDSEEDLDSPRLIRQSGQSVKENSSDSLVTRTNQLPQGARGRRSMALDLAALDDEDDEDFDISDRVSTNRTSKNSPDVKSTENVRHPPNAPRGVKKLELSSEVKEELRDTDKRVGTPCAVDQISISFASDSSHSGTGRNIEAGATGDCKPTTDGKLPTDESCNKAVDNNIGTLIQDLSENHLNDTPEKPADAAVKTPEKCMDSTEKAAVLTPENVNNTSKETPVVSPGRSSDSKNGANGNSSDSRKVVKGNSPDSKKGAKAKNGAKGISADSKCDKSSNSKDETTDKSTVSGDETTDSSSLRTEGGEKEESKTESEVNCTQAAEVNSECGTSVDESNDKSEECEPIMTKLNNFSELRIPGSLTMMSSTLEQSGTVNHTEVV